MCCRQPGGNSKQVTSVWLQPHVSCEKGRERCRRRAIQGVGSQVRSGYSAALPEASGRSSQVMTYSGSSKKKSLPSLSTGRRAGKSMEYLRCRIRRLLFASMKPWRRRCTSAEKSGKMAILEFPRWMLPFSLATRSAASLSLKFKNFAMNVRGEPPERRSGRHAVGPFHCQGRREGLTTIGVD